MHSSLRTLFEGCFDLSGFRAFIETEVDLNLWGNFVSSVELDCGEGHEDVITILRDASRKEIPVTGTARLPKDASMAPKAIEAARASIRSANESSSAQAEWAAIELTTEFAVSKGLTKTGANCFKGFDLLWNVPLRFWTFDALEQISELEGQFPVFDLAGMASTERVDFVKLLDEALTLGCPFKVRLAGSVLSTEEELGILNMLVAVGLACEGDLSRAEILKVLQDQEGQSWKFEDRRLVAGKWSADLEDLGESREYLTSIALNDPVKLNSWLKREVNLK